MVDFHKPGTPWYCPADCGNGPYDTPELLLAHLKKAVNEGEPNHIDIVELEGWDETSMGIRIKSADDLEES